MKVSVIELFLPEVRTEGEIVAYLSNNPALIEPGSRFVVAEFPLFGGRVDALFMCEEGPLFVEVKRRRRPKDEHVMKARDQLMRYYEGAKSMARAFNVDDAEIRIYLVIGILTEIENRRYEVEFKEGKLLHGLDVGLRRLADEDLTRRWEESKDQRVEELKEATVKRDEMNDEIEAKEDELEQLRDLTQLQRYGNKMLCLIPNFYSVEKLNSRKCFVCGERSGVVISIREDKTYGLCREHFKQISGFTPNLRK